jgi:predicted AAA+ superfamily ATPase
MLAEGKQHVSYTLDDDDVRSQAVNDPRTLVTQAGDGLLVIDEVQRAPELLLAIKAEVDRNPQPGRFVLTGSSDLLRLPHTPDSLAGRAVTLPLWGLSAGELAGAPDDFAAFVLAGHDWHGFTTSWSRDDYATALCCGSYPEAMRLEPADRSVWLRSYLDRLLRRDVPNVGRAIPAARLRTMLRLLAANPSGELVLARLADQLAVTAPTVRDHIELLEAMYLVQSLPPWTANLTKREVGRNKTSVCDAGLATQLTRATPAKLTSPALAEHFGALLESFVTMELIKQQTWTTAPFELFHFRDRNGPEVDIVMEFADGEVFLIEVKASQSYRSDYFTHMKKLAASIGNRCLGGVVLGTAPYAFRHADKFWGLPISALWESVP